MIIAAEEAPGFDLQGLPAPHDLQQWVAFLIVRPLCKTTHCLPLHSGGLHILVASQGV